MSRRVVAVFAACLVPVVLVAAVLASDIVRVVVRWRFDVLDEDAYITVYVPNKHCRPDDGYERRVNGNYFQIFGCLDRFRMSLSRVRSERGMCYMAYFTDSTRSHMELWCVTWQDVARELRR